MNNIAIQTQGDLPTALTKGDDENGNLAEETDDEDKNKYNRLKNIDINVFHDLHGHNGMSRMRAKDKVLGMYLSGKFHCNACSTVKAKLSAIGMYPFPFTRCGIMEQECDGTQIL